MATPSIVKVSLKTGLKLRKMKERKTRVETENKVTMATPSIAKVSLKLLIDTKGNRVLFPEARKDFVDFLFNLLLLPLGTL
ncbi:hypothetical protein Vadar_014921 [Vaccinium darrowii]|uniref:Uncharacterized protein n=1 Tax=Vaccinium darrowii TaxID=229202 RepID=A0ACB7XI13_9ERIC|nr:hypothetical protein Vadar_014921 [Vaccinium darrowii]